jgi:hypothetical protein
MCVVADVAVTRKDVQDQPGVAWVRRRTVARHGGGRPMPLRRVRSWPLGTDQADRPSRSRSTNTARIGSGAFRAVTALCSPDTGSKTQDSPTVRAAPAVDLSVPEVFRVVADAAVG